MKKLILLLLIVGLICSFATTGMAAEYRFGDFASKNFDGSEINVALVGEPRADAIKKLLPEFTELTGIKVNLDILPYPTLQERQGVALAQNSGNYDVVHVDCVWVGQYAGQGWVVPVEDYIVETNPEVLNLDDYIPSILEELTMWEDVHYGLPFITAVFGLYYRTDIFEKYDLEVPETWEDLREVVRFINENETNVAGITMMGRRGVQLQCTWDGMLWSYGGDWYDKEYNPVINSPEAVASLEYMKSLLPYAVEGVLSYDYSETAAAFAQGKAAMNLQWENAAPLFTRDDSKIKGNWNFALYPGKKQADGSIYRAPTTGGWGLMIPKDSREKEAAWEFIVWATTQEMEKKLAFSGTGSRSSTFNDPELNETYITYDAMFKSLEVAKGRPRIPAYSEMADIIEASLSSCLVGDKTAQEALNEANSRLKMVLMRYGY